MLEVKTPVRSDQIDIPSMLRVNLDAGDRSNLSEIFSGTVALPFPTSLTSDRPRREKLIIGGIEDSTVGNESIEEAPTAGRRERRRTKAHSAVQTDRLWLLHRWQGQVLKIEKDAFTANVTDLSDPNLIEVVEFPIAQVAENEVNLLRPGSLFYWFIGYKDIGKTRNHISQIWMRRGGRMSKEKYETELAAVNRLWGAVVGNEAKVATGD